MSSPGDTVAVVLLSMGGPDSLDAVRPFLESLFSDPMIFPLPAQALLAPVIARLRAPKARRYYASLGGRSPLIEITNAQARALEAELNATTPSARFRALSAFRYFGPNAASAARAIRASGARTVVALPMYPQYCRATTASSLLELRRALAGTGTRLVEIPSFSEDAAYQDALAAGVSAALSRVSPSAHVVLSAHGVPVRVVERGDPYVAQVRATARALAARLPEATPITLAFQSRVGPLRWVGPETGAELVRLGTSGVREVVLVPVSFVAEHVETLDELDVRLRAVALRAGVREVVRVPALGTDPAFVRALAGIVRRAAGLG